MRWSLEQEARVTLSEEKQTWKTTSLWPANSFLSIFGPFISQIPAVLSSEAVAKIELLSREKQQWSTPSRCFTAFWSAEPLTGSHSTTLQSLPAVSAKRVGSASDYNVMYMHVYTELWNN